MENFDNTDKEEIFSKRIPAGKRTYFFDVKATRGNELYMTITESKKRFRDDGTYFYDKHKIFLYQEDFEKFVDGLEEAIAFIRANSSAPTPREPRTENYAASEPVTESASFSDTVAETVPAESVAPKSEFDISFDDLGN